MRIKTKRVATLIKATLFFLVMMVVFICFPVTHADDRGERGGVAFSFIGQVNNQAPNGVGNTSSQFGYLDSINGLDSVFTSSDPALQNEHTAMFTFNVDAVTVRKKLDGQISIGNREGTFTIYQVGDPSMTDFSSPETFKQGVSILTASLEQQVIADLTTAGFYVTNTLTVTGVQRFTVNDQQYRLAKMGQKFISTYSGRANTTGTALPSGFLAGFAVASNKIDN